MKKLATVVLLLCALVFVASAQKKMKPWTEWSEKDVNKILNDSPWGQTQTETNTSEMFYSPANQGRGSDRPFDNPPGSTSSDRSNQGALNQSTSINYRIRLLTAKPIRQALARRQEKQNPQLAERLKAFAEQTTDQFIVVAVDYDSSDRRFSGPAMQLFNSAVTGTIKNDTYLEVKDGKRVFLQEYIKPTNDGMGAKFVFPRKLEGELFVTKESGYLRFYSEISRGIKLNMRFKVSDLLYEGTLEY